MPTSAESKAIPKIQPFDPKKHDRAAFSCGVEQVDNFLKRTAKKADKADVVRIWVVVDAKNHIIGFYGINMHSVAVEKMPEKYKKKTLKHGLLPAAFIAMIGVEEGHQRKGLGKALVADALNRIAVASDQIAACVIMLDVLNDGDEGAIAQRKNYYENFGFIPLPNQQLRLFMPIETARQASRE